jgi:elongation factor Ts
MAEITAALVKDLREKTGAGMMDCKRALTENGGDIEVAIDWLRKKGLAAAAKKSGRVAAEGLVGVASAPNKAAIVEINAETDFVARNETFQEFVTTCAKIALEVGDNIETISAAFFPGTGRTVAEELTHLVATIGENMTIRRAAVLSVPSGVVATYVHSALKPGLGKIGVLIAIESSSGRTGAGTRRADRTGACLRQGRRNHREDGRWPYPEILRGSGAAGAGLGA